MIEDNPILSLVADEPQNILLGCYLNSDDSLIEAQTHTMERLMRMTPKLKKSSKVLILCDGCLYVPFFLASTYNCKVFILCESQEKEAEIIKEINAHELSPYISTTVGEFNYMQYDFDYFDFVWSINTLSKKEDILTIMREVKGVLAPQGRFILMEEVLISDLFDSRKCLVHNAEGILNFGNIADFEQVSNIRFEDESKVHYSKLEQSEFFGNDDQKTLIHQLKNDTENNIISWNFIQFQKRNS